MPLGAYSIVRFRNDLNDQRVNLGVIVWHPIDGYQWRFTSSIERAKAVDPRVRVVSLKEQLTVIQNELESSTSRSGECLGALSRAFREGLHVSTPYPARIHSLRGCLDELYGLLVTSEPEIRRASSKSLFQRQFVKALGLTVAEVLPKAKLNAIGIRPVNGVHVDVGVRVVAETRTALWHALSLQSKDHAAAQIAEAKATAMDILTVRREFKDFEKDEQLVVLQPPKPKASEGLNDAMAWLRRESDDVFLVPTLDSLSKVLEAKLRDMQ